MDWFNKKIVGLGEIVEEVVKKEVATPNTLKQTILRKTTSCIVLECGHKIKVTAFGKVPTRYTNCYECEQQESTMTKAYSDLELYKEKTYLSYQLIEKLPVPVVAAFLREMMVSPEDDLAALAAREMAQYFIENNDDIAARIEDCVADFDSRE